ncbi:MAG: ABC transporter ATP-binding protein [Lachnospiraceae bacterium]|nr:ABC transporter ATP-binding protein [Lachnospiraceae bacterium]
MQDRILEIKDLQIVYDEELAVKRASLFVERGEVLCIVGESGSGKSTVIRAITGNKQVKVKGGQILFEGEDLVPMKKKERQKLLGTKIGLIQQNPAGAFNPIRKFNVQFKETLKSHSLPFILEKLNQLFVTLGLKNTTGILKSRPYEMSGGMNQRIAISAAMLMDPELLLCDEITSALDVTTAISVTDELLRLKNERGTTIILVTHNLGIAANIADRIAIMSKGEVIEFDTAERILHDPQQEYTKSLLRDVPKLMV